MVYGNSSDLGSANQLTVFRITNDVSNTDITSQDTFAEFKIDGANSDLLIGTDDGGGTTTEQDSGVDMTHDTWFLLKIDFTDLSDVKFYVDGNRKLPGTTFDMSALDGNTFANRLMAPWFEVRKDSGTEANTMRIDYVKLTEERN